MPSYVLCCLTLEIYINYLTTRLRIFYLRETKQAANTELNLNHLFLKERSRQIPFKCIDREDLFSPPDRIEFFQQKEE